MTAPIGYFVHHQGRGHAERAAALIRALPEARPVTVFCAKPEILRDLPDRVEIIALPSLFERRGDEASGLDHIPAPQTTHCAPLGWPAITQAMATLTDWFARARPALMVCDVSAEIAQLARLASVPHVHILQHGDRTDPGHRAAYDGAAGLLAPFDASLAQPDWAPYADRICYAGGLGVDTDLPSRAAARAALGLDDRPLILAVSGGGGDGFRAAPFGVAARATPDSQWITIGEVQQSWHATEPANLDHDGWVDDPQTYIAAADLIVASTGNTTCQQILAAGKPWLAVPEWRYFDEQVHKARALHAAGVAVHLPDLPSSADGWQAALDRARATHDPGRQRAMSRPDAAAHAAAWLDNLATDLWSQDQSRHPDSRRTTMTMPDRTTSILTLAKGRAEHLSNVVLGLNRQTQRPLELVVGVMQDKPYDLPQADFPIRQIMVQSDHALPLAAARNTVAREASGDVLAFVDVDCIPHPTLVADYAAQATPENGCLMGEVMYLPGQANTPGWTYDGFDAVAEKHSDRQGPPDGPLGRCEDYRCFWSLNFALHRDVWARAGGFDESFVGYGGEDTDFGKTLDQTGVPIHWVRGAKVYHQYHPHAMPPIHHMDSVIVNAERFREKWGYRTMEHWLYAFELMGLIRKTGHFPNEEVHVLRQPGAEEEALCKQQSHMPYANTTRVIRTLQERAAGRRLADREAVSSMRAAEAEMRGEQPMAAE